MDTDGTRSGWTPAGGVAHVRIAVRDLRRAAAFYRALFGWAIVGEGPGELRFRAPGGMRGAFWADGEPSTAGPELYVRVEGLDAAVKRAVALGGARLARPGPGPAGGRMAQVLDTEGNRVCLWEEAASASMGNIDPSVFSALPENDPPRTHGDAPADGKPLSQPSGRNPA